MKHPRTLSIGMFDSGVGGLTVLQQLSNCLPNEKIIYFGDTARLPYGDKSSGEILRYSIENAQFLMDSQEIKILVNACNTSAAYSSQELRELCPVPVVNVVEAGVDSIVKATKSQRMAVLGTRGTIRSKIYEREILKRLPEASVLSIACPLFTLLVEEQFTDHLAAKLIVKEYLAPLKNSGIDTLLLGCTHYPLLRHVIEEELGHGIAIVDSAVSCAAKVAELLSELDLETTELNPKDRHQFFVSDDPERFSLTARNFLDAQININVQLKPALLSIYSG